jgi:catechol 2,3-dioxygenase-like lactoylglutathione lyase family enzyme
MAITFKQIVPVLAVDDLDRAVSFYRDKLGLKETRSPDDPEGCFLSSGDIGSGNVLYVYKSSFRRGENTTATFVVDDVTQSVEELRGKGVRFEDYDMPGLKTENGIATLGDMQAAWFKDTEGNTINIMNDQSESLSRAA